MIRGRQGRLGLRNMSLSTFCDLVWVEIWDDCSPNGDIAQYRRIVTELFIEGKDPYDITYEVTEHDKKGKAIKKTKRLSDAPSSGMRASRLVSQAAILAEWNAKSAAAKAERELASTPDGV